jgi:hypothetical protein
MAATRECKQRDELEQVLGTPKYAMKGELYTTTMPDGSVHCPDVVEVYERDGCIMECCFSDGVVESVIGYVPWTRWELAARSTSNSASQL